MPNRGTMVDALADLYTSSSDADPNSHCGRIRRCSLREELRIVLVPRRRDQGTEPKIRFYLYYTALSQAHSCLRGVCRVTHPV